MKLKCILIDDEPLALNLLESYTAQIPHLEVIGKFTHPVKALEYLRANPVDLLIVDIQMPDLNGLELISQLVVKPLLIFTTAFSQYAVEGFKADAVDYLLKPIDFPDFQKAVNKATELFELRNAKNASIETNKEFLFIKSEYKIIRINFSEIIYIQGMSEYVKIHLTGRKPVMSLLSLKALESQLPASLFMRVHKSIVR